jgi:pimeloyl-ACP methyl ester carboxylesterase
VEFLSRARANGIELEYEVIGEGEPMLLIMGFSVQLIQWPDAFCRMLADRGHRVIRFDNRDVGLSSKVDQSYSLDDMADDAAGLLSALGIDSAHVVGASMGGYLAQLLTLRHPARVRSMCSIMSSTGSRSVGQPSPEMFTYLMTPAPSVRSDYVEQRMVIARKVAGPGFAFDEDRLRDTIGRAFDRCYFPQGAMRQIRAVMAAPDRTAALGAIAVPSLVIHGTHDLIVHPSGGRATAEAIPGARLLEIEGMGHDLPSGAWPRIVDAIVANASLR